MGEGRGGGGEGEEVGGKRGKGETSVSGYQTFVLSARRKCNVMNKPALVYAHFLVKCRDTVMQWGVPLALQLIHSFFSRPADDVSSAALDKAGEAAVEGGEAGCSPLSAMASALHPVLARLGFG